MAVPLYVYITRAQAEAQYDRGSAISLPPLLDIICYYNLIYGMQTDDINSFGSIMFSETTTDS